MSLEDLELFLLVSEAGTLSTAAHIARTTPSSVSRRMTTLETAFGAKLLSRTTRRLTLTTEGELLRHRIAPLLREIDQIRADIRQAHDQLSGLLRVSASVGFGGRYVAPLMGEFRRRYPAISLDLVLSDDKADIVANEVDVAIRVGRLADSALRSLKLASLNRIACASPAYLDRRGRPERPVDLEAHECIVVGMAGRSNGAWRFAHTGAYQPGPGLTVSSHEAASTAALATAGIAHLPLWMVADDLRSGRLERVLHDYEEKNAGGVYLLWRDGTSAKVRAFVDFVRERIAVA